MELVMLCQTCNLPIKTEARCSALSDRTPENQYIHRDCHLLDFSINIHLPSSYSLRRPISGLPFAISVESFTLQRTMLTAISDRDVITGVGETFVLPNSRSEAPEADQQYPVAEVTHSRESRTYGHPNVQMGCGSSRCFQHQIYPLFGHPSRVVVAKRRRVDQLRHQEHPPEHESLARQAPHVRRYGYTPYLLSQWLHRDSSFMASLAEISRSDHEDEKSDGLGGETVNQSSMGAGSKEVGENLHRGKTSKRVFGVGMLEIA